MSQIADFANTTQVNKSTQNEERELQHQKKEKQKITQHHTNVKNVKCVEIWKIIITKQVYGYYVWRRRM